jgi:hypothetical protein
MVMELTGVIDVGAADALLAVAAPMPPKPSTRAKIATIRRRKEADTTSPSS